MDITPNLLRTLEAVVASGSFSRAAAARHLSQPAVSKHVRLLEERVGVALVERAGKRALATSAGELLLGHASRALAEIDAAVEAIHQMSGTVTGRVRLGTTPALSAHALPPLYRRLRAEYPSIGLVVTTSTAVDMVNVFIAGDLDVMVATLPRPDPSLVAVPLFRDSLTVIAPPDPRWFRLRRVRPQDLARHPLILYPRGAQLRTVVDEWFARHRVTPQVVMEMDTGETIRRLVADGVGVSIYPTTSLGQERQSRSLAILPLDPPLHRQVAVIRRRDKPASAALRTVLALLADLGRDLERAAGRRARRGVRGRAESSAPTSRASRAAAGSPGRSERRGGHVRAPHVNGRNPRR